MVEATLRALGREVNPRQAAEGAKMFDAMAEACRNTTKDTVRHFLEVMVDQKIATCTVLDDYSHMRFSWNGQTNAWVSQEGPGGPCGRISIATFERDGSTPFWKYTEKKITTKPDGLIVGLGSCQQFPDYTLNYTWRAAQNFAECTYVENAMN